MSGIDDLISTARMEEIFYDERQYKPPTKQEISWEEDHLAEIRKASDDYLNMISNTHPGEDFLPTTEEELEWMKGEMEKMLEELGIKL